jgi:hypothetical protein
VFSVSLVMTVVIAACGAANDEESLDRRQMLKVLRSLHSPIKDFELRFEGDFHRLAKPDYSKLPAQDRIASERNSAFLGNTYFQGTIAYREDSAVHLDLHDRFEDQNLPVQRAISCLFRGKYSKRTWVPDRGGPVGGDRSERGSVLKFQMPKNPFWFYLYPILALHLETESAEQYRFAGWRDVEGHKCAVLEFYVIDPKTGNRATAETYYVDLGRGGHPLKLERYVRGSLAAEVVDIKLAYLKAEDGESVWFPISGHLLSHGSGLFEFARAPTGEQTFQVLRGSVAINQGFNDNRFTLDYGLGPKDKPNLKPLQPVAKRSRSESSESLLAKAFAKAEAVSPELVAETPSQRGWLTHQYLPSLGLFSFGLVVVFLGILLKRRQ